jgi:hypothetical protein
MLCIFAIRLNPEIEDDENPITPGEITEAETRGFLKSISQIIRLLKLKPVRDILIF